MIVLFPSHTWLCTKPISAKHFYLFVYGSYQLYESFVGKQIRLCAAKTKQHKQGKAGGDLVNGLKREINFRDYEFATRKTAHSPSKQR